MVRESTWDVTLKLILLGKFAFISPVTTSTDGRWVAMMRCIPVALPSWARRHSDCSTSNAAVIMRSASSSTTTQRNGILSGIRLLYASMLRTPTSSIRR